MASLGFKNTIPSLCATFVLSFLKRKFASFARPVTFICFKMIAAANAKTCSHNFKVLQLACLSTGRLACLSTGRLACLSTGRLACLSTGRLACLSTGRLACLSTGRLACLSTDQLACLSTGRLACLSTGRLACLSTGRLACLSTGRLTKWYQIISFTNLVQDGQRGQHASKFHTAKCGISLGGRHMASDYICS